MTNCCPHGVVKDGKLNADWSGVVRVCMCCNSEFGTVKTANWSPDNLCPACGGKISAVVIQDEVAQT